MGFLEAERLFAWWWWRSPNRPHVVDRSYIDLLDRLPPSSLGLDLGSRSKVRDNAVTVDITAAEGVQVIADGDALPFAEGTFDYVWCNAVLEHVPHPMKVSAEIIRTLRPQGLAFIQVPFLENVHGWPQDYYRFTLQGLRVLFSELDEVKSGVSAGPSQVLPDLIQYYCVCFAELQKGKLLTNLLCLIPGFLLLPVRLLDHLMKNRPSYWKWARAYYWVGKKPVPKDLPEGGEL
jgi:SAM-dependent methyltransferase